MRWRGSKRLRSTCAASTAISSSSSRENRGTSLNTSGLHAMGRLASGGVNRYHNPTMTRACWPMSRTAPCSLIEKRNILERRRRGTAREICMDVGQIRVGNYLGGERRHAARRTPHIREERGQSRWFYADARARRAALAFMPVTGGTHHSLERLLAPL